MSLPRERPDVVGTLVLAAIVAGAAIAGKLPFLVLMLLIGAAAAGEQFRLARARGSRPLVVVGFASIGALFVSAFLRGERAPEVFGAVVAATIGVALAVMILRRARAAVTRGILATLIPVLVVGLLGAYVLAIRGIPHGLRLVLGFGVIALAADLAVAFAGARAHAAPNRLAFAIAGALAGAAIAALVLSKAFTWRDAIAIALLIGPIVAGSDTIASMLERSVTGAKKRAVMLRRIDCVLLSAPVFFYVYRALAR